MATPPKQPRPRRNRTSAVLIGAFAAGAAVCAVGNTGGAGTLPAPSTPPVTVARTIAPSPPPGPAEAGAPQPNAALPLPDESPTVTITTLRCREAGSRGGFVTATVLNPPDGGPSRRYLVVTTGASSEFDLPDGQSSQFSVGKVAVGAHTMTVTDVNSGATAQTSFTIEPCDAATTTTSTTAAIQPDATTADTAAAPPADDEGTGTTAAAGAPAAPGHAQVIAQGIVAFTAGSFQWDHQAIGAGDWPLPFEGSPAMLLVTDGPDPVLVEIAGAGHALLHRGEASFVAAGSTGAAAPTLADAVTTGHRVTFVATDGAGTFVPGDRPRDVNLVRDVLAPGETFAATSALPILVITTDGVVTDTTSGTSIAGGTSATLGPAVSLHNTGDQPAIVLTAIVGDPAS